MSPDMASTPHDTRSEPVGRSEQGRFPDTYPRPMVDPLSIGAGAVAKAVQSAAEEGGKAASGVVSRVFGPAADEIGEALRRYTAYRVGNVERIAEAADRKSCGREGVVSPRLAHAILEEGSWCDDELMAEYLGGVLAAGRTPSGRDDRAVTWSTLITSMSALQLRTHFVLYREWAHALRGNKEVALTAAPPDRTMMYVNLDDLLVILNEVAPDVSNDAIVTDILTGLIRFSLIQDADYFLGSAAELAKHKPSYYVPPFRNVFAAYPSQAGLTLYGWACGLPGFNPALFVESDELLAENVGIDRPAAALPGLFPSTSKERSSG